MQRMPPQERRRKRTRLVTEQLLLLHSTQFSHIHTHTHTPLPPPLPLPKKNQKQNLALFVSNSKQPGCPTDYNQLLLIFANEGGFSLPLQTTSKREQKKKRK